MTQPRTLITASEADIKFSNKTFIFKRNGLKARNLMMEDSIYGVKKCSLEVLYDGEWEYIQISFRDFLRDEPELINS